MVGPRALLTTAFGSPCALAVRTARAGSTRAARRRCRRIGPGVADAFEEDDCPVEVPAEHRQRVTCGVLIVPERRTSVSDPAKTLSLPVIVITSRSPNAARSTRLPDLRRTRRRQPQRALVLPRLCAMGERRSRHHPDRAARRRAAEPSLDCPELDIEHFVVDGALLRATRSGARAQRADRSVPRAAHRGGHRSRRVHERGERRRPRRPAHRARLRRSGICTGCRTARGWR